MTTANASRTHCVTFKDGKNTFYAVKSREYGDQVPMGISQPEVRCAMSESDATRLADFLRRESVNFTGVRVHRLRVKKSK